MLFGYHGNRLMQLLISKLKVGYVSVLYNSDNVIHSEAENNANQVKKKIISNKNVNK